MNLSGQLAAVGNMIRKIVRHLRHLGAKSQNGTVVNTVPFVKEDVTDIFELLHLVPLPIVHVKELHTRLCYREPLNYPETSLEKSLTQWKMEIDDSPIFRFLYRSFGPKRHLEFGTWYGAGTVYCLEECDATVWTINLPQGELTPDGTPAYGHGVADSKSIEAWARKIGVGISQWGNYRTDTIGFIGRLYLGKGLGNRVCQIYCDSRDWDISHYPTAFFDTVLIDGGHQKDIVASDTQKALALLRSGGLILWHDFCPDKDVIAQMESPRGVLRAVLGNWDNLRCQLSDVFWIKPSWILVGVKR